MDERIHHIRGARKLLICAVTVIVPAFSIAAEPISSSFMRARLVSGFGAGTNQGMTQNADNHVSPGRGRPRVAEGGNSAQGLVMGVAPPQVARLSPKMPFVIRSAKRIPPEHESRTEIRSNDLAALIRTGETPPRSSENAAPKYRTFDPRTPYERSSIRVEMAPAVRRISLGEYDSNRTDVYDSQAIVRLVDPLEASSLYASKPNQVRLEKADPQPSVSVDMKTHSLSQAFEADLGMIDAGSYANRVQEDPSTPALLRALADPEVSGLIETFPKTKADSKSKCDSKCDEILQWEMLLSE